MEPVYMRGDDYVLEKARELKDAALTSFFDAPTARFQPVSEVRKFRTVLHSKRMAGFRNVCGLWNQ